jgi:hypothetical protein
MKKAKADFAHSRSEPQLDIEKRIGTDGNRRLALTPAERAILKEKIDMAKVLEIFLAGSTIPQAAEEAGVDKAIVMGALDGGSYPDLRNALIDRVIGLFLDVEHEHRRSEIIAVTGMSLHMFTKLTQSKDFEERYADYFANIKADPVLQAVQQKLITDLLPRAYRVLDEVLGDRGAPATARMRAAVEVLTRAGVRNVEPEVSERHELAKFLGERNVEQNNLTINNYNIPPEYAAAQKKYNIIDGEFKLDLEPSETEATGE